MKKTVALMFFAAFFMFASATASQAQKLKFDATRPVIFDPEGVGVGYANWVDGIGETDSNGQTRFGLLLQKNISTNANVSADAELKGLKGLKIRAGDSFGYDIRNDSPCTSGSPRFNVRYKLPDGKSGLSFIGGCTENNAIMSPQDSGWKRLTFNVQTESSPVIPSGSIIQSVILCVDEEGTYTLDNIMFRGVYIDK